jgi:hypothetical protein
MPKPACLAWNRRVALAPGLRLGAYRIFGLIGAGEADAFEAEACA